MTEPIRSTVDPARVPPYLLTGGRSRPVDEDLAVEAQVITTLAGRVDLPTLRFEVRDIVTLCDEPPRIDPSRRVEIIERVIRGLDQLDDD